MFGLEFLLYGELYMKGIVYTMVCTSGGKVHYVGILICIIGYEDSSFGLYICPECCTYYRVLYGADTTSMNTVVNNGETCSVGFLMYRDISPSAVTVPISDR